MEMRHTSRPSRQPGASRRPEESSAMFHHAPQGFRFTVKTLAGSLLVGTALALSPVAMAQDAAPPAEAPAAPAAAAPAAPSPSTVIATVGGKQITEGDLSLAAEDIGQQLQQVPPDQQRAFLLSVLIDMKLMAEAARENGIDQSDEYKARLSFLEDKALRRIFFAEKIANAVTPDTVKAAYDKYVAAFKPAEEVHARHILVATEEEAKQVKADLDGGKPFEVEAMEKTTDPSGKNNGGDLGFFQKGQMVPEFETAAFALEPGQVSEPVKSQFGWHVIKLEEKRQSAPTPFEQMQQQLGQQAIYDAYDAAVSEYKAKLAVEIPDAALAAQVKAQTENAGQ
jgi:peptidyl-prolyl cis-trans isomerase C